MEFCEKCGSLMVPKKTKKSAILECRKCGKRKFIKDKKDFKIVQKTSETGRKTVVVDSEMEVLPKTKTQCPKCENNEAFWWMQQTRSADEPPTRFFRCTKCSHTWREYQ
ncbi:MAG: transcription factor S [Candidatus Micrarchaeota archaeon]|nr:transcription factor S [Candidatus Micrarchaeota archaeon]